MRERVGQGNARSGKKSIIQLTLFHKMRRPMVFFVFEVFFVPKKLQNKKNAFRVIFVVYDENHSIYVYCYILYDILYTRLRGFTSVFNYWCQLHAKKTLSLSDKCVYIFATLNWANY